MTPLPPPGRSLLYVISTPDFFHPTSPHMSLFRLKLLSAVRESRTVPRVAGWNPLVSMRGMLPASQ